MKAVREAAGLAAAILLVGAAHLSRDAVARPHGDGCHGGGKFNHVEKHIEALNLEPAARESVNKLLEESREARRASRDEMRDAHERMIRPRDRGAKWAP